MQLLPFPLFVIVEQPSKSEKYILSSGLCKEDLELDLDLSHAGLCSGEGGA